MQRILWPIDFSGVNFVLRENTGGGMADAYNQQIANSSYGNKYFWPYDLGTDGIFSALETALNAASTNNTYEFQVVSTAQDTFGRRDFRVKLVRTAGSDDFEFGGAAARLIGAATSGNVAQTAGEVVMADSYAGSFITPEEMEWDRRVFPANFSKTVLRNDKKIITTRRNTADMLRLKYFKVPGAMVFSNRTTDPVITDFATEANLNSTEQYAALEHFWDTCVTQGLPFAFIRHANEANLVPGSVENPTYYRVISEPHIEDFENFITDIVDSMGKDYYHIEFQAVSLGTVTPQTIPL